MSWLRKFFGAPTQLLPQVRMHVLADAQAPERKTGGAAGFDLYANLGTNTVKLSPGQRTTIPCGVRLELPPGVEAQIRGRSGLANRNGIQVLNSPGTIDSDYRGEIHAILHNSSTAMGFTIKHGDRIAQMVFARYLIPVLQITKRLSETERGSKGFGSTGT